jgi:hypothetical protein
MVRGDANHGGGDANHGNRRFLGKLHLYFILSLLLCFAHTPAGLSRQAGIRYAKVYLNWNCAAIDGLKIRIIVNGDTNHRHFCLK